MITVQREECQWAGFTQTDPIHYLCRREHSQFGFNLQIFTFTDCQQELILFILFTVSFNKRVILAKA